MSKRLNSTNSQVYKGDKLGTEEIELHTGKVIRRRIKYDKFRKMYFTVYDNCVLRVTFSKYYYINGGSQHRLWKEVPQHDKLSGNDLYISELALNN